MMTLNKLVHIGDIELTLALATAIAAWLVAARAWRMAFWWCLLFTVGFGLVGANKVAFMAWGAMLPGLDFKAASGHATGVTAVFPTLFYLLVRQRGARAQAWGVGAGLVLGVLMGVLLVADGDHSAVEALAGWLTGAAISLGTIRIAGALPPGGARPHGLLCSIAVFASAAWLMHSVPHGYLMFRTAALLSVHTAPFPSGGGSSIKNTINPGEITCIQK
jgi:hypothetical protein